MTPKLYVIPGSHPCLCIERALELKGIAYDRVDLPPVMHKLAQKVRFGETTVPGLELDGERIVGSRRIIRRLDHLEADPPLFPADPERRAAVDELERWGDEVLQTLARRLSWAILRHEPAHASSYAEASNLPIPDPIARASTPLVVRFAAAGNGANDDSAREDLAELPGHLDRIDGAIEDGVLGSDPPNAADLQIGSSIRLLMTLGDVRPLIEGRPAADLAMRVFPTYVGEVPAGVLPVAG